jgi:hypothetical protein
MASPSAHGARCSTDEIGGHEGPALRKRFFLDRGRQRVARARSIELVSAFFKGLVLFHEFTHQ